MFRREDLLLFSRIKTEDFAFVGVVLPYLGGSTVFYEEVEFMLGAVGLIEKLVVAKKAEVGEL